MARMSAEGRASAGWRAGGRPAAAPKRLDAAGRALWRQITASRPPDYFQPGALELLEQFCVVTVALRHLATALQADPRDRRLVATWATLTSAQLSTATKLRLANSSRMRADDGRVVEREAEAVQSRLIAPKVVRLRGHAVGG